MKFYRISMIGGPESGVNGEHCGFKFCTSQSEAAKYIRSVPGHECTVNTIDVKPTKKGILSALNLWGNHPDNG